MIGFASEEDLQRWVTSCSRHRDLAKTHPAYGKHDQTDPWYWWRLGPFSVYFALEKFHDKPMWHGSVSRCHQVGYQSVIGMGSGVEEPEDRLVFMPEWPKDSIEDCRSILRTMFADLIRDDDKSQQVLETQGPWVVHWMTAFER